MKRLFLCLFLIPSLVFGQTGQGIKNGYLQTDLNANGHQINNLVDPTSAQQAATKNYADTHGGGGGGANSITQTFTNVFASPLSFINDGAGNWTGATVLKQQPSNTIFGNPTNAPDFPIFMTPSTTKIVLSLDQVSNTSDALKPLSNAAVAANTAMQTNIAANTSGLASLSATVSAETLNSIAPPTANVSLATHKIINLADPSAALDGANKEYVDAVATGGPPHPAVAVASTGNLALTGEQTIDGVTTSTSRILVKDQTTGTQNGIYVTASGAWTRATDANSGTTVAGSVFVTGGSVNISTSWGVTTPQPIVIGTTVINYTLTGASITYTASGGITLSGTNFSLSNMGALTVKGNNTGSSAAPSDISVSNVGFNLMGLTNPSAISFIRINADNSVTARSATNFRSDIGAGTVTSVDVGTNSASDLITYSFANTTSTPTLSISKTLAPGATFYGNPVGSTTPSFMSAATALTTLGGTTVGQNVFTLTNPNTITFMRINADNTVSTRTPAQMVGNGATADLPFASATTNGILSFADWNNFSIGAGTTVTAPSTGTLTLTNTPPLTTRVNLPTITSPGLTIILPPASGRAATQYIELVDVTTGGAMASQGIIVKGSGTDTIDGIVPSIGESLPRGGGYFRINSNGTNGWITTVYHVTNAVDSIDPTKKLVFQLSGISSGTTRTMIIPDGNNAPLIAHPPVVNTFGAPTTWITGTLNDLSGNPTGDLLGSVIHPANLTPFEENVTSASGTWTGTTDFQNGNIDSVKTTTTLTGALTINLPSTSVYQSGERLTFRDLTNSITSAHSVTFAANGSDLINGNATFTVTASGPSAQGTFIYDGSGAIETQGFNAPTTGTPAFAGALPESGGNLTWTVTAGQTIQSATAAPTGNDTLLITGPLQQGMIFRLAFVQDATGGRTLTLPNGSQTPSDGKGVIIVSTAANTITEIEGTYYGVTGGIQYLWHTNGLNFSAVPAVTCNTGVDQIPATWGTTTVNWASSSGVSYVTTGNYVPSATQSICRIDIPVYVTATAPTVDVQADIYNDDGTGKPSTLIASSATVSHTLITSTTAAAANAAPTTFTFSPAPSLVSGTRYCIGMHTTATTGLSATVHYIWPGATSTSSFPIYRGSNGTTWTNMNFNTKANFKTYMH